MARFAWITPGYPPDRGGVSDHSLAMVTAIRAAGHEVLVCSKPHERGFDNLDAELRAFRPDSVIVCYVPLGYAPKSGGISPRFAFWSTQLAARHRCSTLLMAHEVNVPPRYHWARREPKLALLGIAQIAQFEVLARAYDRVVFSHEGSRAAWAERLPRMQSRLDTVRICSTIPVIEGVDARAELRAAGYAVPEKAVLFFGSGHDSVLFDYIESALIELCKIDPDVQLIIVGMDQEKLRVRSPSLAAFGPRVQALGYVGAREVSLWLQVAELVLAPQSEGVNARKTTVMAALEHGRAVVTTSGFHTRNDISWAEICALTALDSATFAATAARCFRDENWRTNLGESARVEYEKNASAKVTAAQLTAFATAPSSVG